MRALFLGLIRDFLGLGQQRVTKARTNDMLKRFTALGIFILLLAAIILLAILYLAAPVVVTTNGAVRGVGLLLAAPAAGVGFALWRHRRRRQ